MSALPNPITPKRPPQTEGRWFRYSHDLIDDIIWVASGWCEHHCLEKILSLVDQREARLQAAFLDEWARARHKRPQTLTGEERSTALDEFREKHPAISTEPVTAADLAEGSRWDVRMVQVALKHLCEGDYPALERMSREQALKRKLLTEKEAGPPRECSAFVVLRANWPRLAKIHRAEAEDAAAAAESARVQEADGSGAVVHVTEEPLYLPANHHSRPVPLSKQVRKSLSAIETLQAQSSVGHHLEMRLTVVDRVGTITVSAGTAAEETKGEAPAKCISQGKPAAAAPVQNGSRAGEITRALAALDPPVLIAGKLLEQSTQHLNGAPPKLLAAAVRKRRIDLGIRFQPGLVRNLAAEVHQLWVLHGEKAYEKYKMPEAEKPAEEGGYWARRAKREAGRE